MNVIIIEGPKGTGKSTLINNIKAEISAEVRHFNSKNFLTKELIDSDIKTR